MVAKISMCWISSKFSNSVMTGTSSQVLNPPSLYSNLYSSLYLNVEFTDSSLKISRTIKKLLSESSKFSIYSYLSPPYIGTTISYIYLFIKYYLYFYNGYLEIQNLFLV